MALPSGYTELEYIKSSGTQYINTQFYPNQDTRLVIDAQMLENSGTLSLGGQRYNSAAQAFVWISTSPTQLRSYYNISYVTVGNADLDRHIYDKNKNVTYIDGSQVGEQPYAAFNGDFPIYLFACDEEGNPAFNIAAIIYAAQIYDNGELSHNYIPCQNPNGQIGLYDEVGEQFYGNAGTGAFEAGPIVIPDEGIASLKDAQLLISSDNATIELELVVIDPATNEPVDIDVESVSGTVNGAATTWTLSGGLWTATAPLSEMGQYLCVFDVATSDGKTVEMRLPLYYGVLSLITDRTQADVDELLSILQTPFADWTTEQAQLFYSGMSKGAYNASDLNRVGAAMVYIAKRISSMGYSVTDIAPKLYWMDTDVVTLSDMSAYLSDLAALQAVLPLPDETPTAPSDMAGLTFTEANDIEQILAIINTMLTNITLAYMYAGELYGGEI